MHLPLCRIERLTTLGDIAAAASDPAEKRRLHEQACRTVAGCAERLNEEEMTPLRARLEAMGKLSLPVLDHGAQSR
jgi:hypothetical protein